MESKIKLLTNLERVFCVRENYKIFPITQLLLEKIDRPILGSWTKSQVLDLLKNFNTSTKEFVISCQGQSLGIQLLKI